MLLINRICHKIFTYFSSPYIFYKFLQGITRKFKMFVCPLKTYKPIYVILCAIWYHLYNFKNAKSTHWVVLLLLKLQVSACNFTKSNALPWVFFTFLKCTNGTKSRNVLHIMQWTIRVGCSQTLLANQLEQLL